MTDRTPSVILSEARDLLAQVSKRKGHTAKVSSELAAAGEAVGLLIEKLSALEAYVDLAPQDDTSESVQAAMGAWDALPWGATTAPNLLKAFAGASPLVKAFYKRGFDITKIYRFAEDRVTLARKVGDSYEDSARSLAGLRRARANGNERSFFLQQGRGGEAFLALLESEGILEAKHLSVSKGGAFKPFKRDWLKAGKPTGEVLLRAKLLDPAAFTFLNGEWLNAYVFSIIRDQFSRSEQPFELYTDISYQPPRDVVKTAGEFDVLGRVGSNVICVECKSGHLDPSRGDIKRLVQKKDAVTTVIQKMFESDETLHFFLVTDPTHANFKEVLSALEGTGIVGLVPDMVRATMANTFLA